MPGRPLADHTDVDPRAAEAENLHKALKVCRERLLNGEFSRMPAGKRWEFAEAVVAGGLAAAALAEVALAELAEARARLRERQAGR